MVDDSGVIVIIPDPVSVSFHEKSVNTPSDNHVPLPIIVVVEIPSGAAIEKHWAVTFWSFASKVPFI